MLQVFYQILPLSGTGKLYPFHRRTRYQHICHSNKSSKLRTDAASGWVKCPLQLWVCGDTLWPMDPDHMKPVSANNVLEASKPAASCAHLVQGSVTAEHLTTFWPPKKLSWVNSILIWQQRWHSSSLFPLVSMPPPTLSLPCLLSLLWHSGASETVSNKPPFTLSASCRCDPAWPRSCQPTAPQRISSHKLADPWTHPCTLAWSLQ